MSPIFFLCSVADTVKHFYWCFGNGLFFRCVIPDLWSCFLLRSCFLVWLKFNNWKNDKYTFLPGKLFFPWNNYWYLFSDKLYTENQGHFLVSGNVNIWGLFFFFFFSFDMPEVFWMKSPALMIWCFLLQFPSSSTLNHLWCQIAASVLYDILLL